MVEEKEGAESGEEVNQEAFEYELREAGLHEKDNFQGILMSAPQEKRYTQVQIVEKQLINDFFNGERL
eukprot:3951988-Pleurochrysis_carterae.AAC.1